MVFTVITSNHKQSSYLRNEESRASTMEGLECATVVKIQEVAFAETYSSEVHLSITVMCD